MASGQAAKIFSGEILIEDVCGLLQYLQDTTTPFYIVPNSSFTA
jgi:hypothetical protein